MGMRILVVSENLGGQLGGKEERREVVKLP
jgi:hypothetical protein